MIESDKPPEEPPAAKLPPSGLAEDLLGPGSPAAPPPEIPQGPERLYSFADVLAREHPDHVAKKEERIETWVTFVLGGEAFGLPVNHVQEILRVTTITRVPHAPHLVRGVSNMRGRVLPVVDLRVRLGLPEASIEVQSRIVVVSSRGRLLGLLVDSVQQVVRIAASQIQPPPADVMTASSDYIVGVCHIQDRLVIMLDVNRVLLIKDSLAGQEAPAAPS